jgi:hypothetical protein
MPENSVDAPPSLSTPGTPPVVQIRELDWSAIRKAADAEAIRARMRSGIERMEILLDRAGGPGMLFDADRAHSTDRAIRISAMDESSPIWIIGDLHGDLLALEAALAQVREYSQPGDIARPRIIFLRDFFDDEGFGLEVLVRICPSCGTTRATPGECDACHEANVRYFCTNHGPGLWLDASACPKCGARFGDRARGASVPAPATPARRPARPPAPPLAPVRDRTPSSLPPYTRSAAPPIEADPGDRRARLPMAREKELEPEAFGIAPWERLLRAALRAGYAPSGAALGRTRSPITRGAGGCLRRLVLVVVFLFVALVVALFFFGRALLHHFS